MLLVNFLNKLLALAEPKPLSLEERPYTTAQVFPVKTPLPDSLNIHTLTGVVDYLEDNPDGLDLDTVVIQIVSPHLVQIKSRLTGPFEDRADYLASKYEQPIFQFGKYMDIETFIIELQAKFVPDEMTENILQLVGTITDDLISVYADDGVTQQVTAKNGIGMKENRPVPNPVVLRPFRTFIEIDQPVGQFVFRLKSGNGTNTGRPAVALFEADGGMWQLVAIHSIRNWLREQVPTAVVILA